MILCTQDFLDCKLGMIYATDMLRQSHDAKENLQNDKIFHSGERVHWNGSDEIVAQVSEKKYIFRTLERLHLTIV